ncbi:MAG: hypothetical protein MI754_12335 [Chromatiales bacterium]|nr:hypothetical protein [Chromatiales bacterium]
MSVAKIDKLAVLCIACVISVTGYCAEQQTEPDPENFRFALPAGYVVTDHDVHPQYKGAIVTLSPKNSVQSEDGVEQKVLRVQTYLAKHYPNDFAQAAKKPKEFLHELIASQLKSKCSEHTVDSGIVRRRSGKIRINWWTSCRSALSNGVHEYERGRLFLSKKGAYLLSHINRSENSKHRFATKEVKWFDKYLYNSGFCKTGENCGQEGALLAKIFEEQ